MNKVKRHIDLFGVVIWVLLMIGAQFGNLWTCLGVLLIGIGWTVTQ